MSVLVYDCGSVENTVTAILDTESGAMIIRGNGYIDNYADDSSPWYSEHSDILQVTVDKGITRIGSGTFYGCENLSFVEIANTVTSIGADVFQNCTSLTSIKIPKSITDIGNGTFTDSGLTEVKFYGNPPTVGTDIFDGVTADVYTPEGNEEWTETAKGTVAGNGSNLTWKTFDSKPNLIEYDELDYLWSKIKKYVDNNVSVTQVVSSGTKIATITVNGVDTDLYSSPFSGTVGDSTSPIYIDNGVPTACGGSLDVDITGNAATATTATNANNAKLTHTVGNTEYPLVFGTSAATNDGNQALRIGCPTTTLANCALRCKAYCAAANTQGESTLIIGNNLATASANNSRGRLILYGTSTGYTILAPGYNSTSNITVTLPSSTGTLALTSSDITGSSASCTGNAATATTATNANNAKLTHSVDDTYHPIVLASSAKIDDSHQSLKIGCATTTISNCALRGKTYYGAANTQGESVLVIGNNIAKTSANNSRGGFTLYGTGAYYLHFRSGDVTASRTVTLLGGSSDVTLTLPSSTGTLALTSSNITGNAATATTASECSGNSASATYATNVRITPSDGTTAYPVTMLNGSTASTNYVLRTAVNNTTVANSGLKCIPGADVAANTEGTTTLVIGNALAKASADNRTGNIRIYGNNKGYTTIKPGYNSTSSINITLPSSEGTLALTSDITSAQVTHTRTEGTYYAIEEITFPSGFMIKFVYVKNTSITTPTEQSGNAETITYQTPFNSTGIRACLYTAWSRSGSCGVIEFGTNSSNMKGAYVSGNGSGSSLSNIMSSISSNTGCTVTKNNPYYFTIIIGYK